jgi:hypothetical protein
VDLEFRRAGRGSEFRISTHYCATARREILGCGRAPTGARGLDLPP